MKYLSVCSGIEAATVAWHHMGWQPVAFSEIEPFPSAVLAHHYPHVPNLGDMTKFKEWNLEPIDLLVGGTPCQSFSVAGLRKGLDDPRGNLMLTFLAIAERYRPQWIVWENVPGVLSSNGGRDFGTFLGALGELGYGWAYRILDAQWFGVAQRRRRCFVIANLGDQAGAAKVLFESESVCRDFEKSGKARKGAARDVGGGPADGSISGAVTRTAVAQPVAFKVRGGVEVDSAGKAAGKGYLGSEETAFTLAATQDQWVGTPPAMQVRRFTPVECERLQGFPDNYSNIPWRKKDEAPDGSRYKALGNSMAVPCMRWIGERIAKVTK